MESKQGNSYTFGEYLVKIGKQGAGNNVIRGIRYFEYYPRSSSTEGPSIEIVLDTKSFKFRLN